MISNEKKKKDKENDWVCASLNVDILIVCFLTLTVLYRYKRSSYTSAQTDIKFKVYLMQNSWWIIALQKLLNSFFNISDILIKM